MNPPLVTHGVITKGQHRLQASAASARSWSRGVATRLRHSVLPDPDAPIAIPKTALAHRSSRMASRRLGISAHTFVLAGILLLLVIPVALLVFRVAYADRIYPAIVVGDVPVGGLTATQAEDRLAERAAALEDGLISFTYGGQTWTPSLRDLGATVNLPASLAEAEGLGRSGDAASRLTFTGAILRADQRVALQIDIDQDVLAAWFDTVDREIGRPAVDATMTIDGSRVSVAPESTGTVVDREAATQLIHAALADLLPVDRELPTRVQAPRITVTDLRDAQATAEHILQQPVTVTSGDEEWTLDPMVVSPFLVVEPTVEEDAPSVRVSIDTEELAATLRTDFGEQVNRLPVNAVIGWDERAVVLEPGQDGAVLDSTAFAGMVADSFLGEHGPVEIPVVVLQPRVTGKDLDRLGIDTLLGQGDSNFSGGVEGRDENVRLATDYLNGTLVPPGGIFSFNDAIGEITAERGYAEALVVQGEGVGRDVGGGVCQVSTTIFRAALNGGMPITEWYPHTFRLPHYELDGWGPGFDASILQWGPDPSTWPDFRFENYTGSWLLIQSYTDYPYVYVNIYGTGDGRTVTIEADAIAGNAFAFTRFIHDASGNVIAERRFESYFI